MESGWQYGQDLAANSTNPWWSNGTSEQITCYDSYQAYYPGYSSPWHPWMPGTDALPMYNYNPVYYNKTEEQPSPPAKRMRLQDEIAVNSDYGYVLQPPQDQNNTVVVLPGLISNPVADPLLTFPGNVNYIPSSGLNGFETPLQDLQQLQQDDQPISAIPSFKSIRTFAGTGVPLQRRGIYGKSVCLQCNKTFNIMCHMKLHMFEYTGENPFICNICGRGFNRNVGLKNHLRSHSKGDFPCPLCSNAFPNADVRLFHVLTEVCTGDHRHLCQTAKGWNCLLCDDWYFTTREQAVHHVHKHEQVKGMFCPVCNQNIHGDSGYILIEHVKKQHQDYIPSLGL